MSLRNEDGQTLPELMIATVIGLIVVFAAFLLLIQAVNQNFNTSQREDASSTGRALMAQITREVRAQVCTSKTVSIGGKNTTVTQPAIVYGDNQSITFTDDLSGGVSLPIMRTISYDQTKLRLIEKQYAGSGNAITTTFPGYPNSPTKTITLAQNVVPVGGLTQPIFKYYPFNSPGTPGISSTAFTPPVYQDLTANPPIQSAGQTVDIRVTFIVRGSTPSTPPSATDVKANRNGTTYDNNIYTRTADPSNPLVGANCS